MACCLCGKKESSLIKNDLCDVCSQLDNIVSNRAEIFQIVRSLSI